MKIYLLCPVRNITEEQHTEIRQYTADLEMQGHKVHLPFRDAPQDDPTGLQICLAHLGAMARADRIDIFWDITSDGSHFDLGMAFALGKKWKLVKSFQFDGPEKSYEKVIRQCE